MIQITDVTKNFDDFAALEDFTLHIKEGHIYGIVGYNGAGKTTLLKTIAGIYRPEKGNITIDGDKVFENEKLKSMFFMVQDEPLFLPQSTLNGMAVFYRGFYPGWRDTVYKRLVDLFGLNPDERINGFSKGMQRQASIILGLSTMPKYLLLDESFDGLDLGKRNLLKALLFAYLKHNASNILISSHNLKELEGICDHIAMIKDKKLAFGDSVEQMRKQRTKFNVVFANDTDKEQLYSIGARNVEGGKRGYTFISDLHMQEVRRLLEPYSPVVLESVSMTLEEIFLEEMEEGDYDFENFFV